MSLPLQKLKSKPLEEQIYVIERLTEQNLHLVEKLRPLFEKRSKDSIFHVSLSTDRHKIVRAALLAAVAADVTTLPAPGIREPYRRRFDELCRHFAIDPQDVAELLRYASRIENWIESESLSPEIDGE